MKIKGQTLIFRITHVDNLRVILARGLICAPNCAPEDDKIIYRSVHDSEVQQKRSSCRVRSGPGGVITDYVPFYFGERSPMLYVIKHNHNYPEGQMPMIYLVSTAQKIADSGQGFAFTDGHALIGYSEWFDDLEKLASLNWDDIHASYWNDSPEKKRRKQAEFLVHKFCRWEWIIGIVVIGESTKARVEGIFSEFPKNLRRTVKTLPKWYY